MKQRSLGRLRALLILLPLLAGCQNEPGQRYPLKGRVISSDRSAGRVMIAHEAIPGYMDAMTMPFSVGEAWALEVLSPGQEIEATLVVAGERSWIEEIRISESKGTGDTFVPGTGPRIGAEVPDFGLLDQDGRRIGLAALRGRPLLLTFIYTRCPLPDFCPRTSALFHRVHLQAAALPDAQRPRLLTVSFDPEYDTPEVMRRYGRRYVRPEAFGEWMFATGSPEETRAIAGWFGLSYWKESDQFAHSLVTALVGADGKLERLYAGNDWTPEQVLAELR